MKKYKQSLNHGRYIYYGDNSSGRPTCEDTLYHKDVGTHHFREEINNDYQSQYSSGKHTP